MGDMCVNFSRVKPFFFPIAMAADKNGDDNICRSEIPNTSQKGFEAFVNLIKVKTDPLVNICEKEILSSQLYYLQKLASQNGKSLKKIVWRISI